MRLSGRFIALRATLVALLATAGVMGISGHTSAHASTVYTFQLSPTFPNDTGPIATTAVGQDTGVEWNLDYPQGWQIDSSVEVYVVSVAHVTNPGACSQAAGATKVYTDPGNSSGIESLSLTFVWPASATIAAGGQYYAVCLHPTLSTTSGVDMYSYDGKTLDNNTTVYKVLYDAAPAITVSATTAYDGQTVTVTGVNWRYYYYSDLQEAGTSVLLVQYLSSQTYTYADQATPQVDPNTGDFTVHFHITEAPGTYYVCIGNAYFRHYAVRNGGVKLQVLAGSPPGSGGTTTTGSAAQATATTTTQAKASTTPTTKASASPSTVPTESPSGNAEGSTSTAVGGSSRSAQSFPWLLVLLALVALGAGGVTFYLLRRRRA